MLHQASSTGSVTEWLRVYKMQQFFTVSASPRLRQKQILFNFRNSCAALAAQPSLRYVTSQYFILGLVHYN